MTRHPLAATAVLAALAVGCGSTETHAAILRAPESPPLGSRVELYLAGSLPARTFAEMGLVQAFGAGNKADAESVAAALLERAGEIGCDAVVRVAIDVGNTRAHAAGVCVKYTGPPAEGAPPHAAPPLTVAPPQPASAPTPPRMDPLPSNRM